MPTLLIRCVAPLQSWDTQSRFGVRTTEREPSKSGVIGMLCAALGRPRSDPLDDLAALRMGVRVDQEGDLLRDWHTAGKSGYLRASGNIERHSLITSTRYYLSDAAFLVGLECDDLSRLEALHAALRDPHWLLFLGRKACPPAAPPYLPDGLQPGDLLTALGNYPWLGRDPARHAALGQLRLVLEAPDGPEIRPDVPLSFRKGDRSFANRRVSTSFLAPPPFRGEEV